MGASDRVRERSRPRESRGREWLLVAGVAVVLAAILFFWRPWESPAAEPAGASTEGTSKSGPVAGTGDGRSAAPPATVAFRGAKGRYDEWSETGPFAARDPEPDPGSGPEPVPDPVPDPTPDPAPDPDGDPGPDPDPDPGPDPGPDPDPDPGPDPGDGDGPDPVETPTSAREAAAAASRAERTGSGGRALELYALLLEKWPDSPEARRIASERPDVARLARYAGTAGGDAVVALGREKLARLEELLARWLASPAPDEKVAGAIAGTEGVSAALLEGIVRWGPLAPQARPGVIELETPDAVGGRSGISFVAVPVGYDPSARWPLLLYLHGTDGTREMCRQLAGGLHRNYPGHLVVVPNADPSVGWGPNPHGVSRVESSLARALRDYAADPDRIAVTGISMGGHGSWDVAVRHPDLFGRVLPQAGTELDQMKRGLLGNFSRLPVEFLHGAQDSLAPVSFAREMAEALKKEGILFEYQEFPDAGHMGFPPAEVERAFERLVAARRETWPAEVYYAVKEPERTECAWIRIDAFGKAERMRANYRDRSGNLLFTAEVLYEPAWIRAKISGQEIEVEAKGVERATLFLHPAMVDFSKPVVVRSKGRTISSKKPEVDLRVLLDAARRDRGRPYHAAVEIRLP